MDSGFRRNDDKEVSFRGRTGVLGASPDKEEVQEISLLLGVWGDPPISIVPQSMGDSQGVWKTSRPHTLKKRCPP